MANPIKAAKQMFDQFLSKHDPDAVPKDVPGIEEGASMLDSHDLASQGGHARATALSPKRRRQIAKRAAKARWSKPKG